MASPEASRRGRYVLGPRLGVGEVAEVHLAELEGEGRFRRKLVLKCLRRDLADDGEHVGTFLHEASLVAGLRHPNIVQVLDLARDDETYFMALELVDGPSLANLIGYANGVGIRIPLELGVHVVAESARGLDYAHRPDRGEGEPAAVIHRDVRPANILISRLGEVKVVDFSIALSSSSRFRASPRMPGRGAYVAPELAAGKATDARTDVYSLGAVLYELATGRPPGPREPGSAPALADDRFGAIVARATAADPKARHASAAELAEELGAWLAQAPERAGRVELARWLRETCPELGPARLSPLSVSSKATLERPLAEPPPTPKPALPQRAGRLVGRAAELAAMDAAIARGTRLLVLSGSGGVGKTRLALEWAHRVHEAMGGRALFCDAGNARTPADVAHLVLAQLAPSTVQPRASRDPVSSAHELLTVSGPVVVVLDQLDSMESTSVLFDEWLTGAADLFFVATARAPMTLEGAFSLEIAPLPTGGTASPAEELFFERLLEAGGEKALARWRDPTRAGQLRQVLERLEGLPLAIVVTAARAAVETPSSMALTVVKRDGPASTEATEAALLEAWNGCDPEERAALLQCTVFFGPFTMVAASAVLRIDGDVQRVLRALSDKSLLEPEAGKLRMHQSVRELCREITPPHELEQARARHARYVLGTAEELLLGIRGAGAGRAFALLESFEAELRGLHTYAVGMGDGDVAMRAALGLEPTLARRGDHRNLIALLRVAAATGPSAPALGARGAMAEARAHGWLFDFQPALDAATRALACAAESQARELLAEARSELAMVEVRCGQGADAAKRYRDALLAMREAGDRRGEGVVLLRLANLLSEQGDTQAATMMYRVALEASREAQDRIYEGIILSNLGAQLLDDGRPDQAHQALYLSDEIFRELGEERYGAVSRGLIGVCIAAQGNWAQGADAVERALETLRRIGERGVIVFFLGVLVSARARLGDEAKARWWLAHMEALGDALSGTPVDHISRLREGHILLLEAQRAAAEDRKEEARASIAAARARATEAPRDVLTTLRIAAADLWAHCDEVEHALFPERRRRISSIGKLQLTKKPRDP